MPEKRRIRIARSLVPPMIVNAHRGELRRCEHGFVYSTNRSHECGLPSSSAVRTTRRSVDPSAMGASGKHAAVVDSTAAPGMRTRLKRPHAHPRQTQPAGRCSWRGRCMAPRLECPRHEQSGVVRCRDAQWLRTSYGEAESGDTRSMTLAHRRREQGRLSEESGTLCSAELS